MRYSATLETRRLPAEEHEIQGIECRIYVNCAEPGCDWSQQVHDLEDARELHRRACPGCGKGVIVRDDDLAMIKILIETQRF